MCNKDGSFPKEDCECVGCETYFVHWGGRKYRGIGPEPVNSCCVSTTVTVPTFYNKFPPTTGHVCIEQD